MAKKTFPKVATPMGIAAYSWLNKPDSGSKYSDDKFKLTLVLDGDADVSKIEEACEKAAEIEWESIPEDLVLPFRDGDDHKNEEFNGKTLLTIKSKHPPGIVGPDRKALPKGIEVRSGDLVRVSAIAMPYTATEKVKEGRKTKTVTVHGVTLLLRGVQLVEKRNAGGDVSNDFDDAFDDEALPDMAGDANTSGSDTNDDSDDADI